MPTIVTFQSFYRDIGLARLNLNTDSIKVALSNVAPSVSDDEVLADITQIAAGNGYTLNGFTLSGTSYALDTGIAELLADDLVITASGGAMATWRYLVYYDDTPSSPADPLLGYLDVGSAVSLGDGESRTIDHSATNGIIRLGAGTLT